MNGLSRKEATAWILAREDRFRRAQRMQIGTGKTVKEALSWQGHGLLQFAMRWEFLMAHSFLFFFTEWFTGSFIGSLVHSFGAFAAASNFCVVCVKGAKWKKERKQARKKEISATLSFFVSGFEIAKAFGIRRSIGSLLVFVKLRLEGDVLKGAGYPRPWTSVWVWAFLGLASPSSLLITATPWIETCES